MEQVELLGNLTDATPESICVAVAKAYGVRSTEVAMLELKKSLLTFLHPAELKTAGAIPLSSSAVAARTARTKRAELFNTFTGVRHSSVFEVVKVGDSNAEVIQKLMSAPLLSPSGGVIGVIQVSRKAQSPAAVGPDFTAQDLAKLKSIAASVGKAMAEGGKDSSPHSKERHDSAVE
jgi:hypothetical protein